ncbi:phosphoglycerate mutase family protein [Usnea florida]
MDRNSPTKYTTVPGFFLQDEPSTDPGAFDYAASDFGLIKRTYDTDKEYDPDRKKSQWERFHQQIARLNSTSGNRIRYKVIYMGRHGEGVHNVAEACYGTPAWDSYWSKLDGDGTVIWADAHLTEKGIEQARTANRFWASEMETRHIPVPESYYTSPLHRCLSTANITFNGLKLPAQQPCVPEVKELLREVIGVHTCDRRSSKGYIRQNFPSYTFEPGFAEEDEMWRPDVREDHSTHDTRMKKLLDDIYSRDDSTYISLTTHSGSIASLLRVIGHREFRLPTGAIIPVLVKAEMAPSESS